MRLEQHILHAWEIAPEFQFHKGAIRTAHMFTYQEEDGKFQFHKGAIRTVMKKNNIKQLKENFNSIKVRLERAFPYPVRQTGSDFNSIKVRLEPERRRS